LAPARNASAALPGKPDRHDWTALVAGPQVSAEQVGHAVHPRSAYVRYQPGQLAMGKLGEPGRHLAGVDRLELEAGRNRNHRQLRHLLEQHQVQFVELGGTQRRSRQTRVGCGSLRGQLGPEVAEHGAVHAAAERDSIGADDRDVHQVGSPGP